MLLLTVCGLQRSVDVSAGSRVAKKRRRTQYWAWLHLKGHAVDAVVDASPQYVHRIRSGLFKGGWRELMQVQGE